MDSSYTNRREEETMEGVQESCDTERVFLHGALSCEKVPMPKSYDLGCDGSSHGNISRADNENNA